MNHSILIRQERNSLQEPHSKELQNNSKAIKINLSPGDAHWEIRRDEKWEYLPAEMTQ